MCSDAALLKILHAKAVGAGAVGPKSKNEKHSFPLRKAVAEDDFGSNAGHAPTSSANACMYLPEIGLSLSLLANRCNDYRLFLTITQAVRYYCAVNRKQISKLAAALGKLGGSVKSKAKAKAARENGKKGGRPRKPKP
jgi:hypothetical protein